MKRKIITIIAIAVMISGCVLLGYPVVSNMLFQERQKELSEYYDSKVNESSKEEINSMLLDCEKYNRDLLDVKVQLTDPFDEDKLGLDEHPYVDLLNPAGDGSMGTIEIPSINCMLVIYHGTEEDVLKKGVGHLQGSSLPVGGVGTHAILSGHTGTADKQLFTDLDQVQIGEVFYIHVMNEVLAYKVDNISVVLPTDTEALYIDRNKDYVTLVTCTPYGVNSHRLLVRGVRIPYEEAKSISDATTKGAESTWKNQYIKAIFIGIGLSIVIIIIMVIIYKAARRKKDEEAS